MTWYISFRSLAPHIFLKITQTLIVSFPPTQPNPTRLPAVLGALREVHYSDDVVKGPLTSVPPSFSTDELVHELETRNRLKVSA
jgi:hypothetical protein